MNILLDYFFPITAISPTPSASTAFLKQVCVVANPNGGGVDGNLTLCTSKAAVAVVTDNDEADQLFDAGMGRVYVLQLDSLDDLADSIEGHESDFNTILISSDFADSDVGATVAAVKASLKIQDITYTAKTAGTAGNSITINYNSGGTAGSEVVGVSGSAITVTMQDGVSTAAQIVTAITNSVPAIALVDLVADSGDTADVQAVFGSAVNLENGAAATAGGDLDLGDFTGVVGVSSADDTFLAAQAAIENRCAFHTTSGNKAQNMFYAFGSLLSNALHWLNQQYITMPLADDVETLGDSTALFDDKISFVISDDEFGERLALFACGGKAIVAPYIVKNLQIDMQSSALTYISGNQPAYTKVQAALLEDELQKVLNEYIADQEIEAGTVDVLLEEDNFVASSNINISEPKAMWRVFGEIRQTL